MALIRKSSQTVVQVGEVLQFTQVASHPSQIGSLNYHKIQNAAYIYIYKSLLGTWIDASFPVPSSRLTWQLQYAIEQLNIQYQMHFLSGSFCWAM